MYSTYSTNWSADRNLLLLIIVVVSLKSLSQAQILVLNQPTSEIHQKLSNRSQYLSNGIEIDQKVIVNSLNDTFDKQGDVCDAIFYNHDQLHNKVTISEVGAMAMEAKWRSSFYSDFFIHKYTNYIEMRQANGPLADQERCLAQLQNLVERSEKQMHEKYLSKDINLYQLFDTWGRVPTGLLLGNTFWTGEYDECVRLQIETPTGKVGGRYCAITIRQSNWPAGDDDDIKLLKTGACLPKTCDSSNYKNKLKLVAELLSYQERRVDRGQGIPSDLYCLPDEDSDLRAWHRNPAALSTIALISSWLLVLAIATYKYESMRKRRSAAINVWIAESRFGLSSGFDADCQQAQSTSSPQDQRMERRRTFFKVFKTLAVTHNFRQLFRTGKSSSLMQTGEKLNAASGAKGGYQPESNSTKSDDSSTSNPVTPTREMETGPEGVVAGRASIVDIRVIEGIKVISMCYVIMGHVLMSMTQILANGRVLAQSSSPVYLLANLMPAFAVNSFFSITGLLTSYLLFKQNQSHSFIMKPLNWLAFLVYRYLRIMPMYVLVVLYTKTLARYTGAGPLWDYGTSAMGQRRTCEQESWWVTLLFGANFKSPMEHCIPAAWYLANDFQFFIVTPIFMAALHKNPTFGRNLMKAGIAASYLWGIYGIASAETEDLTPVVKFSPHGFKTYVANLAFSYTRPQHRIAAYLCGLLIGHSLYTFEQDRLKDLKARASGEANVKSPGWSDAFTKYGSTLCASLVILSVLTPTIACRIPFGKLGAKLTVALVMPTYHILFSSSVGLYTLLATTGYGSSYLNAFLSAKFFKPLARLSLCVVLINIEIVVYLVQTSRQLEYMNNKYLITTCATGIVITYLAATLVCVLFEAPIRGGLNQLLALAIKRLAAKTSKSKVQ